MRDLHEMNIGQRLMVTVILVVVIMLALAIIGYMSGWRLDVEAAPAPASAPAAPFPSPYEARLVALDREAMDNAYRSKLEQLFSVWLRDDAGQPARAVTGANQARKSYTEAMNEIEKRQQMLGK